MTMRLVEIWTCDACRGEQEVEVHVAANFVPPAGWGARDGADLCLDCLVKRNRNYGEGDRG